MNVYTEFCSYFQKFCIAKQIGLTISEGRSGNDFIDNITRSLLSSKIFEMNDDVKKLLSLTDPPNINDQIHFPHPVMFFDVRFKKEEMEDLGIDIGYDEIIGIMISEGVMFDSKTDKKVGTDLRITILSLHKEDKHSIWFDTFNANVNITDDKFKNRDVQIITTTEVNMEARKFIHNFVINCLNFVNDPEIEWKQIGNNDLQNKKRVMKNKFPIPSRDIVMITGKLTKYIGNIGNINQWKIGHRFWVRGHFRIFRSERFKEAKNKRKWILPFVKGTGILIEKQYVMRDKK